MSATADQSGVPTILIVDDDASLRLLCRVNLELEGYNVLEAPSVAAPVAPVVPQRKSGPISSNPSSARVPVPVPVSHRGAPTPALASRLAMPEPAPTLRIEIGRVIVRAESATPSSRSPSPSSRPTTSLADYLASRERGER